MLPSPAPKVRETLSFPELLDLLNHTDGEFTAVCQESESVTFNSAVLSPADAPDYVASLPDDRNIWFSVNPTAGPARVRDGKGGAADVTRLAALFADLDVKEGGCADYAVTQQIIDELSKILGSQPMAIIYSGHGVQPIWPVSDGQTGDDDSWERAYALLKRCGLLVAKVAKSLGAEADSVFNMDRLLRVPGTVNNKFPDQPVPAVCHANGGRALNVDEIALALNSCDIESEVGQPGSYGIDSESSDEEIKTWAKATFNEPDSMCYVVQAATEKRIESIRMEGQNHPYVRDGQWETLNLALDFHTGWNAALIAIEEAHYDEVVKVRKKRPSRKTLAEINSARDRALRKLKAAYDQTQRIGEPFTRGECPWCYPGPEIVEQWNKNMASSMKSEDDGLAEDEEWFWNSRPWLRDLRQFARSRRVGPWGMLGCVMVRILSTIPPNVVLPALVGGYASVNTFIAICGDPASSKSALMKAAEDFLIINSVDVPTYNPGSSEAIPKSFAYIEPGVKAIPATKTKPAQPAQPPRQVGMAWSIVFAIPEIETLLEQRNGNAILAALRSIWSAESSSKRYSGAEHNVRIMPHRARCNVILGVQWDFGDVFFGSIGAGTPQRIIYLPSRDTEQIKVKPESPDPIAVPVWPTDDGRNPTQLDIDTRNLWLADQLDKRQDNFTVFTIPQIAKDEVDNGAMYRSGPEELDNTDPLDGHLLLAREKIAVAFAVMDGIFNGFDADHWKLSSVVIRKSKLTRKVLYRKVNEEGARKRNAQAKLAGISRHKAEVAFNEQQDKGTARVAKFIYERLDKSEWTARRDVKNALPSRDRVFFDPAIEELGDRIEAEERPNAQRKPTTYYRRAL